MPSVRLRALGKAAAVADCAAAFMFDRAAAFRALADEDILFLAIYFPPKPYLSFLLRRWCHELVNGVKDHFELRIVFRDLKDSVYCTEYCKSADIYGKCMES